MSWFWNSTPSREEQEIKNNISSINRELTEIATYLDHISSTGEYFHAQVIEQHFSKIEKCINNIRSAASKISTSKAVKIMVHWMDGRLLCLPEWETCFQMVMAKISQDFECGKYMNV